MHTQKRDRHQRKIFFVCFCELKAYQRSIHPNLNTKVLGLSELFHLILKIQHEVWHHKNESNKA
jgi:hypothetical protein